MSKGFDYSKWDRLEISDDEESFHPNLDKGLNIRVNRITRDRKEEEIDAEKKKAEDSGNAEKAQKLESKRPLHINNICRVAEERTIVNCSDGRKDRITKNGEDFCVDDYMDFKQEHIKLLDEFTEASWEKSHEMLNNHGGILLDSCANSYFLLGALDAEMKGDKERVQKLGRQGQIISQIHQLAQPMRRHPRDLVHRFFEKFESGGAHQAFQEGLDHFLAQIAKRAVDKKKEEAEEAAKAAKAEAEQPAEEETQEAVSLVEAMHTMSLEERRGPGGLDPVEVFATLPESLQECFKSGDVEQLKKVAGEMEEKEFDAHFQRCIDSGLWRPG